MKKSILLIVGFIFSFLTRTETINNTEIKYYIDNSKNPKIIMADK